MSKFGLRCKEEEIILNGHKVIVLAPKRRINHEEFLDEINRILDS